MLLKLFLESPTDDRNRQCHHDHAWLQGCGHVCGQGEGEKVMHTMLTHKDHTLHITDFGIDMCHRTDLMLQNYRKERTTNTTQTAEKFSKASHGTHVAVAYSTQRNDSPPHAIWD